ncbi:Mu transposase C-terminal domain-containing protein [Crocosphaera chwakensis]|uniref:Integrase, catalytic region n=1 Tax=Crocosphaera chwakensis CCY0110 TaxID=391612 RepID=A3IT99_9CHRO|nr:Mu transposase C-terminal domain-containing protein [Crocosphaera chwakensis]EAZ90284.1 Integrase, catalytic region [Crocosphaera chwakensis CCY0110]
MKNANSPPSTSSVNNPLEKENNVIPSELSDEAQLKLEVIQTLLKPCDRKTYGQRLQEAAEKLGKSKRTVQRLVKKWEEKGLQAIAATDRSDKGSFRIEEQLQEFIIKTYKNGNKGSRRVTRKQVYLKAKAKAEELGINPPSHMTVYRILQPLIEKQEKKKSIRSPGWRGSQLSVKTRAGQDLSVEYSNHVWQCDHTLADILLVDQYGELLGRPWLTTVIDTYSRCIIGINLGFNAPSSQIVALALRHAILPKRYTPDYQLSEEWGTYGKPEHFYTDSGKDFSSHHIQQISVQLGFVCHFRDRPSEGGIVERPFKTLNLEFFSTLPGYTGSNVQERPEDAEKEACLTLRQLEQKLVRYIVDNYNQRIDARMGDQTRFQRWESGLIASPDVISERELDICLMKQTRRKVQRGGYLQFENLMYRGENLAGYAGESVILRFDPRDVTTVLAYQQESNQEVFLTRAYAIDLETEQMSLDEAKASSKRVREAGKTISNRSILSEIRAAEGSAYADRQIFPKAKKSKKERYQEEQKAITSKPLEQVESELEETDVSSSSSETSQVEVFDYETLQEDYGF